VVTVPISTAVSVPSGLILNRVTVAPVRAVSAVVGRAEVETAAAGRSAAAT